MVNNVSISAVAIVSILKGRDESVNKVNAPFRDLAFVELPG